MEFTEYTIQTIREKFTSRYAVEPEVIVRAPGRINLLGEHTDYNEGFALPAAINREILFAIAPSPDRVSRITSLNFEETIDFDVDDPAQLMDDDRWGNYLLGVAKRLVNLGYALKPFNCMLGSNVPNGAGVSSSAALTSGFAFAVNEFNYLQLSRTDLARIAQWSEHNYVGINSGMLDHMAVLMGKKDHVMLLDCRSLEYFHIRVDLRNHAFVLFDSGVKHSLASSEYNTRRRHCEEGVHVIRKSFPKVQSLRDVTPDQLKTLKDDFSPAMYNQLLYVTEENERTLLAKHYLETNRLTDFGTLMFKTHHGLSQLYQVSCPELDFLVQKAKAIPGVMGARLMGGGFGGCTINLVARESLDSVIATMQKEYRVIKESLPYLGVTLENGVERLN